MPGGALDKDMPGTGLSSWISKAMVARKRTVSRSGQLGQHRALGRPPGGPDGVMRVSRARHFCVDTPAAPVTLRGAFRVRVALRTPCTRISALPIAPTSGIPDCQASRAAAIFGISNGLQPKQPQD